MTKTETNSSRTSVALILALVVLMIAMPYLSPNEFVLNILGFALIYALMAASSGLAEVLRQLQALGVDEVMDDFGTVFSSLGVLVDLPVYGIKCDRSFVRTLEQDGNRQVLLRHLSAMARDLRLHLTVEGVETAAALAIVRSHGADTVQGYVYAKAMAPAQVPRWLAEHRQLAVVVPRQHQPEPA